MNNQPTGEAVSTATGDMGRCLACQKLVSAHFGKDGRWLGCRRADDQTTFILVPTRSVRSERAVTGNGNGTKTLRSSHALTQSRESRSTTSTHIIRPRYRYYIQDGRLVPSLSPTRARIYKALKAHKKGMLSRELIEATGLPHGSIQQSLNHLRGRKLVKAVALVA